MIKVVKSKKYSQSLWTTKLNLARMALYVHKFGGASIKSTERVENVVKICKNTIGKPSVVVVSAIGKTTNSLEKVVEAYASANVDAAFMQLNEVKSAHYQLCDQLLPKEKADQLKTELNDTFVEIEWMIEDPTNDPYNYLYDQIVSVGELASSKILQATLAHHGIDAVWLDARDMIKTNNKYRNASVDWEQTKAQINKNCESHINQNKVMVTQGFIGCTSENFTTTLGREGSDFTAAIFATCLGADSMTVWKDVPGVMTADPAINDQATLLSILSYNEALAMTYYGAKVIHPKTIKPIQLADIPLFVKSFINPEDAGTEIKSLELDLRYPPIVVVDKGNVFLEISAKDNTFIREQRLGVIFTLMNKHGLVLKLDRNTPNAFIACVGDPFSKIESFIEDSSELFNVSIQSNIDLLTVRHGDEASIINSLTGKKILLKESAEDTVQYVLSA